MFATHYPFARLLLFFALFVSSAPAQAETRVICVYDPGGKAGDYYAIMDTFAVEASTWGVQLKLQAYTDEETAAKDYQAGQCDGVVATGVRLQRFNNFPSTIEAMGAVPNYSILKRMLFSLAKYDNAAKGLKRGDNETIGFIPVGAVYLFVKNRNISTSTNLAGKRIATMDYDKAAPVLVKRLGGVIVPADLGSIGPKFNNGAVDACYMTASGYRPFELFRGLEGGGGVIRYPLAQGTLQVLLRPSRFPEGFTTKARKAFVNTYDKAYAAIKRAEADIPEKYWIEVDSSAVKEWEELFLNVRLILRDEVGAYDGRMLGALRKLRCAEDASRAECVEKKE